MFNSKEAKTYYLVAISAKNYFLTHTNIQFLRAAIAGGSPFIIASNKTFQKKEYSHADLLLEIAKKWIELAVDVNNKPTYIFDNIFELLFYLEILDADRKYIYRGQHDSEWGLKSSSQRAKENKINLNKEKESLNKFYEVIKSFFPKDYKLTDNQLEAIAKHYGFNSELIDFTTSLPIAAFFALGGTKFYELPSPMPPNGKIFKSAISSPTLVPTYSFPFKLITVPSVFSRPNHQYGIFIRGKNNLKVFEYTFRHISDLIDIDDMILDVLPDIGPLKPTTLSSFLMPKSDIWDQIAIRLKNDPSNKVNDFSKLLSEIFSELIIKEIWAFVKWIDELSIYEMEGEQTITDIALLGDLFKENPLYAQICIQFIVVRIYISQDNQLRLLLKHNLSTYLLGYACKIKKFDFIKIMCITFPDVVLPIWKDIVDKFGKMTDLDEEMRLTLEQLEKDLKNNYALNNAKKMREILLNNWS